MLGLGWVTLVVIVCAVLLGAVVQTTIGIGLGLVAAPVIALTAPQLMPGSALLLVSTLPLLTLARERQDIDWHGLGWTFPTRVLGTGVGVLLVATADDRQLGFVIGLLVLLAVLLTWRAVDVPVNRGTLTSVGFVSGIMGTATSIGGPPMALLLQRREPRQIRTTLAVYFLYGASLSFVGLAVAGEVTWQQVALAASLVPVLLVGAEGSRLLRGRLDPDRVRPLVLAVCGASSAALVVRSLVG